MSPRLNFWELESHSLTFDNIFHLRTNIQSNRMLSHEENFTTPIKIEWKWQSIEFRRAASTLVSTASPRLEDQFANHERNPFTWGCGERSYFGSYWVFRSKYVSHCSSLHDAQSANHIVRCLADTRARRCAIVLSCFWPRSNQRNFIDLDVQLPRRYCVDAQSGLTKIDSQWDQYEEIASSQFNSPENLYAGQHRWNSLTQSRTCTRVCRPPTSYEKPELNFFSLLLSPFEYTEAFNKALKNVIKTLPNRPARETAEDVVSKW